MPYSKQRILNCNVVLLVWWRSNGYFACVKQFNIFNYTSVTGPEGLPIRIYYGHFHQCECDLTKQVLQFSQSDNDSLGFFFLK